MFLLRLVIIFFLYVILVDLLSRTTLYEGLDDDDDTATGGTPAPDFSNKYQENTNVSGSSSYEVQKQAGMISSLKDQINSMNATVQDLTKQNADALRKLNKNTTKLSK
tara:strand:- start:110 stop:433 length:324 start_codon:yes stop_codon:yes gene_type:complete